MRPPVTFCFLLLCLNAGAQAPAPAVPKPAQRYLDILIKRPQPGTIFERFYAAWLEEGSATELGEYLTDKTKQPAATAAEHLLLGIFHSHRGDDRAALSAYETALKLDPGNAAAWIERSRLEARALDFAAALVSLDAAAKAKPDAAGTMEIGKLRGRALLRLGRNDEALQTWKELAASHAEDEDLSEELIDLLTDEGQYEAALETAQALIKRSRDPVAKTLRQLRLADILMLAERRDEALKTLRESLSTTGADTWIEGDVLGRMSRVFRMSDDVTGLEKFFADLAKEHPQRVALAWQHTQLLGEAGQKDAALQQARALLQANPGRRDLQEGFLDLLESLDLIKEAVGQAQVLVQQNATDKEMLVRLASLQHRAKEDAAAQATLERFLQANGTGEAEHLRVARMLENWEEPPVKANSVAAQAYVRLTEKYPGSIGAHEAQAHYLHRAGQREAALAIWTRLAKSAALEDLLRIAQALQARQETRTALDLLTPRERDFATEPRFFALLVQLGLANKELARTLPWANTRLRLAQDAEAIEAAVKDVLLVLRSDEEGKLSPVAQQALQNKTPLSLQDRCLLAALLESEGKSAEAEKTLSAAAAGDKLIALSQLVQLLQTRQEWEKAAQALQKLIEMPGARTTARVQRMVDFYRRAEQPEQALTWIAEWKKLSPSAVQPWLDESRLLIGLGRTKDALALLRGALRKFPDSLEAASSYATLCMENGQPDEAERTYVTLYEKNTDASTRLRLIAPMAQAAQQHDGLPRLIENFQQRQKQNRASAQPWLALAEIHRTTGNEEERRRCLYEASRLRPQDLALLQEIARSEEEIGLTAEALRTLESAAKIDKTTKTRESIARFQIDRGDADQGYRMLLELANGRSMDARAIEQIADTIAAKDEWERVLTFLEPLLEKHPKDYRLHYLNAVALEETGQEKNAVRAFIGVMGMHEEIPGVISTGRSIGLREQYARAHLTPGAEDWMVLPAMMQFAYAHQQKRGQRSRGGSYGGYFGQPISNGLPRGFIEHAPGVTESPVLALAHVLRIGGGLDAQERALLVPQLKRAGVNEAALLLEASESSPQLVITPEMLQAHPQNITLHLVWLMQQQQQQVVEDPEELLPLYENAWKLFQTSDPAQARGVAYRAWRISGDQSGKWLTRILDLVQSTPQSSSETFSVISAMLQSQTTDMDASNSSPRLTAEEIKRLASRMLDWYRAQADGLNSSFVIGSQALAQNWEGMVEVLKLAISRQRALPAFPQGPPVQTMPAGRRYAGSRNGRPGQDMQLQPRPLYEPPGLTGLTGNIQGMGSFFRGEMEEEPAVTGQLKKRNQQMREGLSPYIAREDDVQLKFLLRLMCAEDEELEKESTAKLQAKDVKAEDCLTAAWLAQRLQKPADALAHLTKALKLTEAAESRMPIENAILYNAQLIHQQDPGGTATATVRALAKELLNAHLPTATSPDEKLRIAQIMNNVGLYEESRALQPQQTAQNRTVGSTRGTPPVVVNPYSRNRPYNQRQQKAQPTPEQLVQEGKNDLAVKEYVRRLRAAIQQTFSSQQGTSGHQELHQIMAQATKVKLWDDVMKTLRDSAESGWRTRLEYAVMLEHIGNSTAPALAEHGAVLAMNPHAHDSHVRLAVILAYDGKFDEAVKHWHALPAFLQEQYLPGVVQEFTQRHQYAVVSPAALAGLLCAWLKETDPKRVLSRNIVQQLQQTLQYLQQAEGAPSLYEPWRPSPLMSRRQQRWKLKPDGTLDLDDAHAKNRAVHRKAHNDLCQAMLQVPELALSAFPPLAGVTLADGDSQEVAALEATALDLLTRLSMPKVKRMLLIANSDGQDYHDIQRLNYAFGSSQSIPRPDAALLLVRSAALRKDTSALNDSLMPLIARVHGKQRVTSLKSYANLLMADNDSFIAAAEHWLKEQPPYALNGEGGAYDEVLRLWLERNVSAPLDDLFLSKPQPSFGYSIPQGVTTYALALGQRGPEPMRQFVHKVRNQWLGTDSETRSKTIAEWLARQNNERRSNSYFNQSNAQMQAAQGYAQWMQNLLQDTRGLALLDLAMEDGLHNSPNWLQQIANHYSSSEYLRTADDLLQTAQAIGFLREAKSFHPYLLGDEEQHTTWFGNLIRHFRENKDNAQINATLDQLGKREPTLGVDLMQALLVKNGQTPLQLDGKSQPFEAADVSRFQNRSSRSGEGYAFRSAALHRVLIRHGRDITAMPPTSQSELSALLHRELAGYPQSEKLDPELIHALEPLLKTENKELIRKVDAVLAAKTWSDLEREENQFLQQFPVLLYDIARIDPVKANAAARHALELLRSSPAQKQAELQNHRETPATQMLGALARAPQLLSTVISLSQQEKQMKSRDWIQNLLYRVEDVLRDPEQAPLIFTGTPWVAEASEFQDLKNESIQEPTLIARLINQIELQQEIRPVLHEFLAKQRSTFGTELLLALLHRTPTDDPQARSFYSIKRPDDSAIRAFIQKRRGDFAKLQPATAANLMALLKARLPDLEQKLTQADDLKQALQPLIAADAIQFEADVIRAMQITDLSSPSMNSSDATLLAAPLLSRLAQTDKPRALALLDHISKLLAQQDALHSQNGQPHLPHQNQVGHWLQESAAAPELLSEVLKRAEESGAAKDPEWLERTMNKAGNLYRLRGNPRRVIALLESLRMLDPAATFNPQQQPRITESKIQTLGFMQQPEPPPPPTLLEKWSAELFAARSHPGLMEELQKRQPQTFGTGILLLLCGNRSSPDIAAFAKTYAEEIAAVSADQKKMLASFFERLQWAETMAPLVPGLSEEFAPLFKQQESQNLAFFEALMKTARWEEIESLYYRTLPLNDPRNPDSRMSNPAYRDTRRNTTGYYSGQPDPVINYLSKQMVQTARLDIEKAKKALQHLCNRFISEYGANNDPFRTPSPGQLLRELCVFPQLAGALLEYTLKIGRSPFRNSNEEWTDLKMIEATLPAAALADAEKVVATFDGMGLLTDAAVFDPVLHRGATQNSLLTLTLWRMLKATPEVREQAAQILSKNTSAQFGHHLLAALLTAKESADKAARMNRCAEQFAKVSPTAASVILNAFSGDNSALIKAETAEGDLALFAPLFQLRSNEEHDYVKAVITGAKFVTVPFRGYTLPVSHELVRLMDAGQTDAAVDLVRAMRRQLESQGAAASFGIGPFFCDGERVSDFLRRSIFGNDHAAALIACQLQAAVGLPEIRTMASSVSQQSFSGARNPLLQEWESRGGWAAPAAVFGSFVQDINKYGGLEKTRGLWLPILHDALVYMGPDETAELSAWFAKQEAPGIKVVAAELTLAKSLMSATEPARIEFSTTRFPAKSPQAAKAFTAAAAKATELLKDESIAPHVRLSLAAFLTATYPGLLDAETSQAWGLAAAQAWHDSTPITKFELETLLNAAAVLPVSESWNRTSQRVLERWSEREAIIAKRGRRYVEPFLHTFVFRFAARTGAAAIVEPMLKAGYGHDSRCYAGMLLECGDWRHAIDPRLRLSLYSIPAKSSHGSGWLPASAETHKDMQNAPVEDALFAEVIALDADDPDTRMLYPGQQWPEREQRFGSFVKKLSAAPKPDSPVKRAHTLTALGLENAPAALALLPQFDELAKVFLPDSLPEDQAGMRCWSDFLAVHAALKLARGDATAADAYFQRLKTDSTVRQRYGSSTGSIESDFRHTLFFCLAQLWQAGEARDPAKISRLALLEDTSNSYSGQGRFSIPQLKFMLKSWQAALAAEPLPAEVVSKADSVENIGNDGILLDLAIAVAGSGKTRLSFQERLHLLTKLSGRTNLSAYTGQIWNTLVQRGFFTSDELIKQNSAILKVAHLLAPIHGHDFAVYMRAHNMQEAAEAAWSTAAKLGKYSKNSQYFCNHCELERATMLIRRKQFKEAQKCLEGLDETDRTTSNLILREALLKMLSPPAPAPAK